MFTAELQRHINNLNLIRNQKKEKENACCVNLHLINFDPTENKEFLSVHYVN